VSCRDRKAAGSGYIILQFFTPRGKRKGEWEAASSKRHIVGHQRAKVQFYFPSFSAISAEGGGRRGRTARSSYFVVFSVPHETGEEKTRAVFSCYTYYFSLEEGGKKRKRRRSGGGGGEWIKTGTHPWIK